MIIDDDSYVVRLLSKPLRELGQVHFALSGVEALSLLRHMTPSVILLDIEMPGIGGIEACHAIHKIPGCEQVPIIFITAHDNPECEAHAKSAGGVGFLPKPLDPALVRARVAEQLSRQAAPAV